MMSSQARSCAGPGHEQDRDVVGELAAVPRAYVVHQALDECVLQSPQPRQLLLEQLAYALVTEARHPIGGPRSPRSRPSVNSSRWSARAMATSVDAHVRVLSIAEGNSGRLCRAARQPVTVDDQRPRVSGQPAARNRALGSMRTIVTVANTSSELRSLVRTAAIDAKNRLGVDTGEHERPPGDPQADAEGGLIWTMAGHVTDQQEQCAVVSFDDVVEVATEQSLVATGV